MFASWSTTDSSLKQLLSSSNCKKVTHLSCNDNMPPHV